jgi:hypothetical protein
MLIRAFHESYTMEESMFRLTGGIAAVLLIASCALPTAKKNDTSGVLVKASISDGTGSFSVMGQTTVDTWTAGMVQVDVSGIEGTAPLRQIHILVYCNTSDVGVPILLNDGNSGNIANYSNGSQSIMPYS